MESICINLAMEDRKKEEDAGIRERTVVDARAQGVDSIHRLNRTGEERDFSHRLQTVEQDYRLLP